MLMAFVQLISSISHSIFTLVCLQSSTFSLGSKLFLYLTHDKENLWCQTTASSRLDELARVKRRGLPAPGLRGRQRKSSSSWFSFQFWVGYWAARVFTKKGAIFMTQPSSCQSQMPSPELPCLLLLLEGGIGSLSSLQAPSLPQSLGEALNHQERAFLEDCLGRELLVTCLPSTQPYLIELLSWAMLCAKAGGHRMNETGLVP